MKTPSDNVAGMGEEGWALILNSHQAYYAEVSPAYDEVLDRVTERVKGEGSIGKADIGALLFWKRLRADTPWVSRLMAIPDASVRQTTALVVSSANDQSLTTPEAAARGRGQLSSLPGFDKGDALASAILLAAAARRMAVYDRRAQAGLGLLGLPLSSAPGRYGRYMALVESIRSTALTNNVEWTARDVDVALYRLGFPTRTPDRSGMALSEVQSTMTDMPNPGAPSGQSPQPLRPRDFSDQAADGAAVSLSLRVLRVIPRTTAEGIPWAILDGVWHGHQLRCVAFPTVWASVEKTQRGDVAIIQGTLSRREGRVIVRVLDLARLRLVSLRDDGT